MKVVTFAYSRILENRLDQKDKQQKQQNKNTKWMNPNKMKAPNFRLYRNVARPFLSLSLFTKQPQLPYSVPTWSATDEVKGSTSEQVKYVC